MNLRPALGMILCLVPAASAQYALPWSAVTCGGAASPLHAGPYTLEFSVGEPIATAAVSGGPYRLSTGLGAVVGGGPAPCYANCDHSTTPPVLNVLDFSCFLNRFASSDTYANCDGSTVPPVLNILDFSCFLNRFASGCS